MKESKYSSIFDNLTDIEFEEILKNCGFKFTKVNANGGLYVNGEHISSSSLREEYDKLKMFLENNNWNKYLKISEVNVNDDGKVFDILEDNQLVA